jgi:hypothetical protein
MELRDPSTLYENYGESYLQGTLSIADSNLYEITNYIYFP